jgi:hypothetical protein
VAACEAEVDRALMNPEKASCEVENTFKAEVVNEVVIVPPFTLAAAQGVPMLPSWTPLSYFTVVVRRSQSSSLFIGCVSR